MSARVNSGRRVSTGLFEIDLVSGQVMRQGRRIPIQDQPFRVLSLLLEHPAQIVTREELQAKLWPADTYVGFDEGLNTAIRKLRVLFGDSADNPRFIETIPRRGYRFIAPVTELPHGSEPSQNPAAAPDAKALDSANPETPSSVSGLLEVMGKYEEAIDERQKGDTLYGSSQKETSERAASMLKALRSEGEKGYWKEHLAQDIHEMRQPGVIFSPVMVAENYAQGGEKDKAFEWLEKSYEAREGQELTLLAVDPVWNNLHGDPRFSDLLRRVGLPDPPPDFRQSSK